MSKFMKYEHWLLYAGIETPIRQRAVISETKHENEMQQSSARSSGINYEKYESLSVWRISLKCPQCHIQMFKMSAACLIWWLKFDMCDVWRKAMAFGWVREIAISNWLKAKWRPEGSPRQIFTGTFEGPIANTSRFFDFNIFESEFKVTFSTILLIFFNFVLFDTSTDSNKIQWPNIELVFANCFQHRVAGSLFLFSRFCT